ncbi:MAG: MerR family transcriptional regulator [Ardenticatenaceae bacterium]|nr:MerR family transcriptional regulator [Ardenticatenaceae bacterium]
MDIFQQTFRIGEFARFARVTIKMLRYYDRLGLLRPVAVDPETNYRYYSAEQLPRLNRIIALKDLGFSLDQVAEILEEGFTNEELKGMLKFKRQEIVKQIATEQERLNLLEAHLKQLDGKAEPLRYDVVVRPVAEQLIASVRRVISDHSNEVGSLFDTVETFVAKFNARAKLPPLAIAHHRAEDRVDAEVMVPVDRAITPEPPIQIYRLPAVDQMACVVHHGSYCDLKRAYEAFFEWAAASEVQTAGHTRVVYLRFGATEVGYHLPASFVTDNSEKYVTELQFPIKKVPKNDHSLT